MEHDTELDRLTQLLRQCLGRIDEAAFRCQADDSEIDHEASIEQLGFETGQLQDLVASLIDAAAKAPESYATDINQVVHRAMQQSLQQCVTPVVLRSRLAGNLPSVSCRPSQVAHAVQRALQLGIGHAGHGGAVEIGTRQDHELVVFELQAEGQGNAETRGRAATLAEFVASWGGRCRIDRSEAGMLLLMLELPAASVFDDRQFD
jgi:K+-sensing histidine kinase KdpD